MPTQIDTPDEKLLNDLETLLIVLDMHPMFVRHPFRILRLTLNDMKTNGLSPELAALKRRFAAMTDADLFAAWGALHNPFRLADRILN